MVNTLGYNQPITQVVFNASATVLLAGVPTIWKVAAMHADNTKFEPEVIIAAANSALFSGVPINDIPALSYGEVAIYGKVLCIVTSATSPAANESIKTGIGLFSTAAGGELVAGYSLTAGAQNNGAGAFRAWCMIDAITASDATVLKFGRS
jgi:hypothetical protein